VDLVRFALMLVGDQSTAEDVVQDAFLGRQTTLRVTDGSARRPRRLNALIPVAAAAAVFAVIGASVALPRLLTGSASRAGKPGISASAFAHDPPFQVIVTHAATGTSLLVRTPAGQVDSTLAPPRGTMWGDVTATANPRTFIVATLRPMPGSPVRPAPLPGGPGPAVPSRPARPGSPVRPVPQRRPYQWLWHPTGKSWCRLPRRRTGVKMAGGTLPGRTGRLRQPLTSPAPGHETRGAPSPRAVRDKATQAASVVKVT
jgi:hypothetical protein